jgi:NAD(P)-dependent dehydrogenase (short-subunit alcohol dehydrogenase family)
MRHMKPKKVVVITGASAGVGRAAAREFARQGARIGLIARGTEGLDAAAREVEMLGGRAAAIPCDVADAAAVENAAEQIERIFGPIDIWVNNAMVSVFAPVHEMTAEEYKRVTEVTYLGYVHGTLAALKRMRLRNRGKIIFVGSALAYRGIPLQSAYCAAKHAIMGFFDSLRTELLHEKSGVQLTVVQMPALNTPQFRWSRAKMHREPQPVPPIFQPEVAARAVMYAANHDRREIYVGMPTVKAIVAGKFLPGLADRYLAKHGYEAQMSNQPHNPARPDNLFDPVRGDFGARGVFDGQAKPRSIEAMLSYNRTKIAMGLAFVLGVIASGLVGGRRPQPREITYVPQDDDEIESVTIRRKRGRGEAVLYGTSAENDVTPRVARRAKSALRHCL